MPATQRPTRRTLSAYAESVEAWEPGRLAALPLLAPLGPFSSAVRLVEGFADAPGEMDGALAFFVRSFFMALSRCHARPGG